MMENLDGDRFEARSNDADIHVQAFRYDNRLQLMLNNLAFEAAGSNRTVQLS